MARWRFIPATTLLATTLFLPGCETPAEIEARRSQFNGAALGDVIATIGEPQSQSSSQAIWHYSRSGVHYVPTYAYRPNGQAYVVSQRRMDYTITCTFTASLASGRVVDSLYDGNGCDRFAPKLKR